MYKAIHLGEMDWTNIKPTVIYDFAHSTNSPKFCNIFKGTFIMRKSLSATSGTTDQAMIMRDFSFAI